MRPKDESDPIISRLAPEDLEWLLKRSYERAEKEVVRIAKNPDMYRKVEDIISRIPTKHRLYLGDSRDMGMIPDESVHLVVTSPPYWTIKKYRPIEGQIGAIQDYEKFVEELNKVWKEVYRVLVPGGRLVVVVGDVLLPRRKHGRHMVIPLHADIQRSCMKMGFENLAPIIWYKIGNVNREVPGSGGFLGKPYQPNAVIKNDIEYILMFRKPGYRKVSRLRMKLSVIPENKFKEWFVQVWQIPGASTKEHPAPFPLELAERLIRMFSFVGDTVLDPFVGTGTTMIAAAKSGRDSIGIEIDPEFVKLATKRFLRETTNLFGVSKLKVFGIQDEQPLL